MLSSIEIRLHESENFLWSSCWHCFFLWSLREVHLTAPFYSSWLELQHYYCCLLLLQESPLPPGFYYPPRKVRPKGLTQILQWNWSWGKGEWGDLLGCASENQQDLQGTREAQRGVPVTFLQSFVLLLGGVHVPHHFPALEDLFKEIGRQF